MKILNFGSLNIDIVYNVPHILIPGETLASTKRELFCGGKGLNQSLALARAGDLSVYHAGCIGNDGEMLINTLKESDVDIGLIKTSDCSSGHAIIQVDDSGQNSIILFGGANQQIDVDYILKVFDNTESGDWLLLQNEISGIEKIINLAYEQGLKIVFNPSPIDDNILSLPLEKIHGFILNEIEGQALAGVSDDEEICNKLLEKYPAEFVVLTLGSRGAVYADRNILVKQPIFNVPVVDTTGAGDTFTGYFLSSFINGLEPSQSLNIANAASAIAVGRKGAASGIPYKHEVEKFLNDN